MSSTIDSTVPNGPINNTNDGNGYSTPRNAKIPLPKPQVHAAHPFKNKENHRELLDYLQQRLYLGLRQRDDELDRYVTVDKNVAGWMILDDEDKKRQRKQKRTGIPQVTKLRLPLTWVHLDDLMTYFAQTFSPSRGMFYHSGNPDEQDGSTQITTIMNNHAVYAGYFRETLQTIYSLLKYNYGGFQVEWSKDTGPKIVKDQNGQDKLDSELRWQGNRMKSIDVYNFLRDTHCPPHRLHCDGEFAATVEMKSAYWLIQQCSNGIYFNCDEAIRTFTGTAPQKFYRFPPIQADFDNDESGGTDWKAVLSGYDVGSAGGGFELVTMHIKLNPTEFGLIDGNAAARAARNRYETWRFTILNNQYIIDATYMNNIHGYLPYFTGTMNDDIMSTSQKSVAEIIEPLGSFASFLMNTHVAASRKKLWGMTVYDPTKVDLKEIPEGETAARIPLKPAAYGQDVRTAVWESESNEQTQQTVKDLSGVMDIINQFFPTQSLPSQIAGIDRAVDSQVAAVQQGANRRQAKAARHLDDVLFRNVRSAMYYNILQYQPDDSDVQDYYTGKPIKVDIAALRNTNLPFIIGQGLKAIDRQAAAKALQGVIFALIQAPQAAQGIDLLGLINYWTDYIDIDTDMNQFRLQPQPQTGQSGSPMDAAAGAGGAPAQGISPAYSAMAMTAPIHRQGTGGQS